MDIDGINRVKGSYAEIPSETGQTSSVLFKREYFFVSLYITTFHKDFFFLRFFFFFRSVGNNEKEANCESRLTVSRLHVQVEDTPGSKCELFLS